MNTRAYRTTLLLPASAGSPPATSFSWWIEASKSQSAAATSGRGFMNP